MLGCKQLLRVGTCGGLQPAPRARRHDRRALRGAAGRHGAAPTCNEPHCPTADWELVHGAVHAAKELGQPMHVGPVVSSDVFYNPDGGQYQRWSDRGILAVEMEAAMLFTLGALRKVQAGCLLTVSDIVVEGEFKRITRRGAARRGRPDDARRARDRHRRPLARAPSSSSTRRRTTASTGRRWPELAHRAAAARPRRARRSSPSARAI